MYSFGGLVVFAMVVNTSKPWYEREMVPQERFFACKDWYCKGEAPAMFGFHGNGMWPDVNAAKQDQYPQSKGGTSPMMIRSRL